MKHASNTPAKDLVSPDNRLDRLSLLTKEKARCSKQNTLPETHESLQPSALVVDVGVSQPDWPYTGLIEAKFSRSPKGFHMLRFACHFTPAYSRNEMRWYKWLK